MAHVSNWAVSWDINRQAGTVDLYVQGGAGPIKLTPPSATDFSAIVSVLSASKALGRPALWDNATKVLST